MPTVGEQLLAHVPMELRGYRNFVCWREIIRDGKPTKPLLNPRTGYLASVDDPTTWASFEETLEAVNRNGVGMGFVFNNTPFGGVDIDKDCDKTLGQNIINRLNSYTEYSPSGIGAHIIVEGKIPTGYHQKGLGLFSKGRYFTLTGNVIHNGGVKERTSEFQAIYNEIVGTPTPLVGKASVDALFSDEDVLRMARNAVNAETFNSLWNGQWQGEYPSQSEADQALMNIFAFYTQSKSQIHRLFKRSALGLRNKHPSYIPRTIEKALDREIPMVNVAEFKEVAKKITVTRTIEEVASVALEWPTGLLGELAYCIHSMSPRPVREISLAAAIGLLCGICGKAYNVSGTGLNQYILLLAKTGVGKDIISKGPMKIMKKLNKYSPAAFDFIGPSSWASGQGLIKSLSESPTKGFVSLVGEIGLRMQRMTARNASGSEISLKESLLKLFNASGEDESYGDTVYSDKANNIKTMNSVAFSFVGESVPESFFKALSEEAIQEGLLPRFTLIEYDGDRVSENENFLNFEIPDMVLRRLASLCNMALDCTRDNKPIKVEFDPQAKTIAKAFNLFADDTIRNSASTDNITRQLWNRAHLKAIKLAALVAVGKDQVNPVISPQDIGWAIDMVKKDIYKLLGRFERGDIGSNTEEAKQFEAIMMAVREWLFRPWQEVERFNAGNALMHQDKIVPYGWLQKKLIASPAFRNAPNGGATVALKRAIQALIDSDKLRPLNKMQLIKYSTQQVAYVVSDERGM